MRRFLRRTSLIAAKACVAGALSCNPMVSKVNETPVVYVGSPKKVLRLGKSSEESQEPGCVDREAYYKAHAANTDEMMEACRWNGISPGPEKTCVENWRLSFYRDRQSPLYHYRRTALLTEGDKIPGVKAFGLSEISIKVEEISDLGVRFRIKGPHICNVGPKPHRNQYDIIPNGDFHEHVPYIRRTNPGHQALLLNLKKGECTSWEVALPEAGMEYVIVQPVDEKRIRILYLQMREFCNSTDEWLFKQ